MDLLVVVDMVNGFVNEGALADAKINKITQNIVACIEKAKTQGIKIVAFKDCHEVGDEEFKKFPPHCLKGTRESELIPELQKYKKDMQLIEKNTTNGFITPEFYYIANYNEFDNVYVVGCCTDICVQDFVTSYLRFNKENRRKTNVVVLEDACYTFDAPNHNAELEHYEAIEYMQDMGAKIIKTNLKKNKVEENEKN